MNNQKNIRHVAKISVKVHKLGAIPSIGLPVACTCRQDAPCRTSATCYAMNGKYRTETVKKGLLNNFLAYKEDPSFFFDKIAVDTKPYRFFRWFTSGDIVDAQFFAGMVRVARKNKGTRYLAFTKKYGIVNDFLKAGGKIPANLRIVFSGWGASFPVLNPYNLPVSHVRLKDERENVCVPQDAYPCSGACGECMLCWKLKNGESVAFNLHR